MLSRREVRDCSKAPSIDQDAYYHSSQTGDGARVICSFVGFASRVRLAFAMELISGGVEHVNYPHPLST